MASQPPAEAESCSSLFEVAQCKSWNQGWQEASRISTAVASASRSMPPSMASQKNWMCRKCWVTTPMNVLYCHSCHSWWQTVLHTQSRSKSRKRKKQKPKKGESKEARENVLCLTPFSNRKKGGKDPAGVPWVPTTPATRIDVEADEVTEDLPLPPAPVLPQPPQPPEIPAEVRAKVEEVKKTLGPAYNQEIEAKILESANAQLAQPPKAEITHGDLNKISQAKKQYLKAKEDVGKIDKDWVHLHKPSKQLMSENKLPTKNREQKPSKSCSRRRTS